MKRLFQYLNPFAHLGDSHYSFIFPFITTTCFAIVSELFAYQIVRDPNVVGVYGIFLFVGLIMYFSFREGIIGGFVSTAVTITYYAYIVTTHHASPQQVTSEWETTIILTIIYLFLSLIIGGLKQIVDSLIEKEANGRRRLSAIIEQLPVGVLVTDEKGNLTHANKQIETILGRQIREGIKIGDANLQNNTYNGRVVNVEDWPLAEVLQKKKPVEGREVTIENTDGEKKHLFISASPVQNKAGKVIAAASIITDITRQKETERMKDDFINMASHELKTPLTTIKIFVQVLAQKLVKNNDKESEQLTKKIDGQIGKLTSLVGELLDVTRMQKGTLSIDRKQFYIREIAEDVIGDLQPTTSHKLILDWHTRLPVYADKERIRQVITNLVTNAIKYSPEKSKIYVGSRANTSHVEVYIKDMGMGIPKSQQKRIFERFYQVKGNSTYPGLGLGLYISSQIIKQHSGKMWVESKEHQGSTFFFSLPIMRE